MENYFLGDLHIPFIIINDIAGWPGRSWELKFTARVRLQTKLLVHTGFQLFCETVGMDLAVLMLGRRTFSH